MHGPTLILRDAEESGAFSFSDLGKDIKKGFQTVGNVAKKVAVAAAPYVGDAVSIGAGLLLRREEEFELMARRAATILDVLAREELSLE
ncbi:hypothetical protein EUX98_g2149 [Antrodiella citrinella]|uniref:Uncharacterized protein n=1 Tax=Antrodiella citrinella TaxID=2447956 RepID=A0A4S4N2I8_9APHY|nr:hypothetical protein EUX98_g2149 [Antrodiella citrinella]